ncbi:hypothetical protein AKJ65_05465 [candidate division MSBL1 archaeon SCGC-AAA259E19]|uniref:Uncharacterized protein n=1 Tax=candidate division MSBL1 archaeon SCGC-AAA259E19 TaxID=1698264 RepID=A0A133UIM0_9EURY|nr:hypothetical protein AKJ65_05465 [candidate division MSBL1 archaeon SCGC-AAA259E19]
MSYEVNTNGTKRILKIDCENCKQNSSIAENSACLEDVIKGLKSHANIDRVLLDGRYVREYNDEDISLLKEFIRAHKSSRYLALRKLTPNGCTDCREERKTKIMETWDEIKRDPKGGLGKLKQWVKELNEKSDRTTEEILVR